MDFYEIITKFNRSNNRNSDVKIYPNFLHNDGGDLVCKGGAMYAYWDGKKWDTKIGNLRKQIDKDIYQKYLELKDKYPERYIDPEYMKSNETGHMKAFNDYVKLLPQSEAQFNTRIIFSEDEVKKEYYATNVLNYTPKDGSTENFDILLDRLYLPAEKEKILWFAGALLTNNTRKIQKFMFLYGGKGTGKGTVLKIFKKLFDGYFAPINLKQLTSSSEFATSGVQEVPLLIDDDCDLSNIADDTNLLKLTAHEPLIINKKYKSPYESTFNGLLISASNQRFKVRNVDSGITRRAIVVEPSTYTFDSKTYFDLMDKINYEIPAIAKKAMDFFNEKGAGYFDNFIDRSMLEASDLMYEFVSTYYEDLGDVCSLKRATELYKDFLRELEFDTKGAKRKIQSELQRYYRKYYVQKKIDGINVKNVFEGFKYELIFSDSEKHVASVDTDWLEFSDHLYSKLDDVMKGYPAQYANDDGFPINKWDFVKTSLRDLDTKRLHYVRVPESLIVLDFDIKDSSGEKDLEANIKAANKFPPTYAELSKSGKGIHLHYWYDGDPKQLSAIYDDQIEVKVYIGKASLRRQLTLCNNMDVNHISSGLPLKEEDKKMYDNVKDILWTEKSMRTAIKRNLLKEYHANTKPSMDFIYKIFKDAEKAGTVYDLNDMYQDIFIFANGSTHQREACLKLLKKINFCTVQYEVEDAKNTKMIIPDEELYFYDVEVFPNLLLVVMKKYGEPCQVFVNPSSEVVKNDICSHPLVGFNNRGYDNHILYARMQDFSNYDIYEVSHGIINGDKSKATFLGAYNLSYTDIYDYSKTKQSLKKWEIEMGVTYDEFEFNFDEPLDESLWDRCIEYCTHDVEATEALFKHIYADYKARCILAELTGKSVNSTNRVLASALLFGDDKHPQTQFVYTDLSKDFPGYKFDKFGIPKEEYTVPEELIVNGKSLYLGEDPSEGGYVFSKPGVYGRCRVFDIKNAHGASIEALNLFGKYTKNFADIRAARNLIKAGKVDEAKLLYGGKLAKYLDNPSEAKGLADALKLVVNSIYGFTSAKFDNVFRDKRNVDNIVAKRVSLFMITLRHAVEELGYEVIHVKTDSIKIHNPDDKVEKFIFEFGAKYGYEFEVENTFSRVALINKAVFIAQREDYSWEAVGAEFAEPFVYKTLFTGEEIEAKDFFITKEVKSRIYIGDDFVGRMARVYASNTGKELYRTQGDKMAAVQKTKGYLWKLSNEFTDISDIDMNYYDSLVLEAIEDINRVGPSGHIIDGTLPSVNKFKDKLTYF